MTPVPLRPALYQAVARTAGREPVTVPVGSYPFVIGRAAESSLVLDGPGIWPRHLSLDLAPDEGLVVSVEKGAIATLEDRPVERHRLRHGEEMRIGAFRIQFLVSPPARRSLVAWEVALWLVLAGVVLAQFAALLALPRD